MWDKNTRGPSGLDLHLSTIFSYWLVRESLVYILSFIWSLNPNLWLLWLVPCFYCLTFEKYLFIKWGDGGSRVGGILDYLFLRIVCNVYSEKMKKRLLRDTEPTLIKALSVCRANKKSQRKMKDLQQKKQVKQFVKLSTFNKQSLNKTSRCSLWIIL